MLRILDAEGTRVALVRALVVDDFVPWQDFVIATLAERSDVQIVGVASDGVQAVQIAEGIQPDLVLLDMNLPGLHGIEVARQIRELAPRCKIIFLTGDSDRDLVRIALQAGASGYVHKWEAATELLPSIDAVLLGRRYLSRSLAGADLD